MLENCGILFKMSKRENLKPSGEKQTNAAAMKKSIMRNPEVAFREPTHKGRQNVNINQNQDQNNNENIFKSCPELIHANDNQNWLEKVTNSGPNFNRPTPNEINQMLKFINEIEKRPALQSENQKEFSKGTQMAVSCFTDSGFPS